VSHRPSLIAFLFFAASGCTVAGGTSVLGTVARSPVSGVRSLGKRVTGEACSSPLSIDDYRKAAETALSQAPGANTLLDATFESRELLSGGFCLRVAGTAGVM
jgi:hypothetical protein